MAPGGDQRVDELVAVGEVVLDGVAGRAQALEQRDGAGRRVEADGVADARVLGREAREHDHDARVGRVERPQPRVPGGQLRQPRAALEVGGVVQDRRSHRRLALERLLEAHRRPDDAPVELGDRDLHGGVERGQPGGRRRPRRATAGGADRLDHRHVERGQRLGAPGAPVGVAVDRGVCRGRPPRGQHRRDERVDAPVQELECGHAPVGVRPQRVGPHAQRVGARRVERRHQGVDEGGVPGHPVRAVEDEADGRARGIVGAQRVLQRDVAAPGHVDAEVGQRTRRLEAVALAQQRVGQEAQQVGRVLHAAVAQVLEGLGQRRRRRAGELGQLGVGLGLASEQQQRHAVARAARPQSGDALRPRPAPAEQARDDDAGAVEQLVQERVDVLDAVGVGAAHGPEALGQVITHRVSRREDLRVGGAQEDEHDAAISRPARRRGRWPRPAAAPAHRP